MIAVSVLIIYVVWINWHTYLSSYAITAAYHTLPVIIFASESMDRLGVPTAIQDFLIPRPMALEAKTLLYTLPNEEPAHIEHEVFLYLLSIPGVALRALLFPISFAGAWFVYRRSRPSRLTNSYNIHDLANISKSSFPHLIPVLKDNLLKVDPDHGYFSREATPIRYGIQHGILTIPNPGGDMPRLTATFDKKQSEGSEYILVKDKFKRGIDRHHGQFAIDQPKLEQLYIKQLGKRWTSSSDLPPLVRALYSALIAFACGEKDHSNQLLSQFNETWQPPRKGKNYCSFDTSGVDEAIEKYEANEIIEDLLSQHAYVNTMLPALLQEARLKGKIWTALFPWLKVVDRTLWYAMNHEGGQCAWSEAGGARAHLLAERKLSSPIYSPFISTAVNAYYEALDEEGWLADNATATTNIGIL